LTEQTDILVTQAVPAFDGGSEMYFEICYTDFTIGNDIE
jgi:hypothetical protein